MREICEIRWARLSDVSELSNLVRRYNQAFAFWGPTKEILTKIIKSKKILLVAEVDGRIVGLNQADIKTPGVCNDRHLFVDEPYRRRGIGGGLVLALINLLSRKEIDDQPNFYYSHKWYAEVPHYNFEAQEMYKALGFPLEGVLRMHTRGRADLWIFAFYIGEMEIPPYGSHLTHHKPIEIDDSDVYDWYVRNQIKKFRKGEEKRRGKSLLEVLE